jgi:hypothetical protein
MPLASSTDLILAGITDILHALNHPSPSSPLPPLTDSHVAALRQLTTVLTNIVDTEAPVSKKPDSTPPSAPTPATSIPVAPLRVVEPIPPLVHKRQSSLRVRTDSLLAKRTVRFAPLPAPHATDTFGTTTGPTGKKRRRTKRTKQRRSVPTKTVHPTQLRRRQAATNKRQPRTPTPPAIRKSTARPQRNHRYGTRSNTTDNPLRHVAATAKALLSPNDPEAPNFQHAALHGNAFNPDTGKLADFLELSKCSQGNLWQQSNAEEIGRLAQGHGNVKGTNTIFFIDRKQIPQGRKVTYLRVVCAHRPEKENPFRVRWTVGGDRIDYPGDVSTKTAGLVDAKLLFNSVVSTPDAKFMTGDLKDFYLGTPMERYEYMRVPLHMLPASIIEEYNLEPLIHNGFV